MTGVECLAFPRLKERLPESELAGFFTPLPAEAALDYEDGAAGLQPLSLNSGPAREIRHLAVYPGGRRLRKHGRSAGAPGRAISGAADEIQQPAEDSSGSCFQKTV
jgi:hypothetical protein